MNAVDIKYEKIYPIDLTFDNEIGDCFTFCRSLNPMFEFDFSDSIFQDEKNLEVDKELILKIFDNR